MKKSIKILLLEDSHIDAEIIERLLMKELGSCTFKLAMTKKNFLLALDEFSPDVILSDNSLPRFNATEALKIVRDRYLLIPFILITGTVSEEYAANIIRQGADDYILKDRMTRLPSAIDSALRHREIQKEKLATTEKLIQSEEKYRTIFFKSPLPKWIYDIETLMFLDVNEAALRLYGYTEEEFLQMTIKDIRPPEDVADLLDDIAKIHHEPHSRLGTWRHLKKSGELIIVETTAHSISYSTRKARMVVINDVTQKIKAEQKIIQSEENLKAIFDNSSEGFILLDEWGTIKLFNDRAGQESLLTTKEALAIGKNVFDFVEADRGAFFKDIFSAVLKGEEIRYDRPYPQADNKITWISYSFNPVRKGDRIEGICITASDITEKKIAEQQKEFDSNNLKALINNTKDLMWSVDRDHKLITFNESFNEVTTFMSGKPLIKGRDILSTQFTEDQRERYKLLYERALTGETFTIIDHFVASFDEIWAEISFYPIHNEEQVIGTACFSRDITKRKKAEAELERLEQEKLAAKIEEQKKITRAMLIAQEKERNAIGIELHDNVNQILVGTQLVLSRVLSNPENTGELITVSMGYLRDAINENRKIAHLFVAPDLKTENLVVQLKILAANMLEVVNLKVCLDAENFNEDLLDIDRKFNIYRIAQEQCTNIVKYAKATAVNFVLTTTAGSFIMSISDNGIGMDTDKISSGIGIRNIRDRLGLFNGTVNIITAPGEGFTLEITIPIL